MPVFQTNTMTAVSMAAMFVRRQRWNTAKDMFMSSYTSLFRSYIDFGVEDVAQQNRRIQRQKRPSKSSSRKIS
eukprot:gene2025-5098_t